MKYSAALSVLALAITAIAAPTENRDYGYGKEVDYKKGYEVKESYARGYDHGYDRDYDYERYPEGRDRYDHDDYDRYHRGGRHHHDDDRFHRGDLHVKNHADTCSASGKQQVCCDGQGLALNCLVQLLGDSCSNEAYCCETGASNGGLVNVNALNCLKVK